MEEQKLTIGLPLEFITTLDGFALPPNIERYYDEYLDRQDIKNSEICDTVKEQKKHAALVPVIGNVVAHMIRKDLTFMESFKALREKLKGMLDELDDLYSCVFTDDMISSLFENMFSGIVKMDHKMKQERENKGTANDILINVLFNAGEIEEKYNGYGLSNVINRLVVDDELSASIDKNYVKPIRELLDEYVGLFFDSESEEEMLDIFSDSFIESKKLIANQALLDCLTKRAIKGNLNVSATIASVDEETLFNEAKESILSYVDLNNYKEEMQNAFKKVLEAQTQ